MQMAGTYFDEITKIRGASITSQFSGLPGILYTTASKSKTEFL